jgi:hypothetical protein
MSIGKKRYLMRTKLHWRHVVGTIGELASESTWSTAAIFIDNTLMLHPHYLQLVSHFCNLALHLIVLGFFLNFFMYFIKLMIFLLLLLLHNYFRLIWKSLHKKGTFITSIFYYMLGFWTLKVVNCLTFNRFRCSIILLLLVLAVKRKSRIRSLIIIALLVIL